MKHPASPRLVADPRARAGVAKVLELDPSLAEAHATLGMILSVFDWDAEAGESEFRRAVEVACDTAKPHRLSRHHSFQPIFMMQSAENSPLLVRSLLGFCESSSASLAVLPEDREFRAQG